ncbi:MAG TPA: hypothetical protein VFT82_02885 [Candidatus Paceibacterota bacterium]|nr:hypothetical protein [Candidatus Paceibacterota bacterium]
MSPTKKSAYDGWERLFAAEPPQHELSRLDESVGSQERDIFEILEDERRESERFTFLEELAALARGRLRDLEIEWRKKHPYGEIEREYDKDGNPVPETLAAIHRGNSEKISTPMYLKLRGKAVREVVRGMLPTCPDKETYEEIVKTIKSLMETRKVRGPRTKSAKVAAKAAAPLPTRKYRPKTRAEFRKLIDEASESLRHSPPNNGELLLPGIASRYIPKPMKHGHRTWRKRRTAIPSEEQLGSIIAESEAEQARVELGRSPDETGIPVHEGDPGF